MKTLCALIFLLIASNTFFFINEQKQSREVENLKKELKTLYCDISSGFGAERAYTYPILRTIDEPSNYALDVKNPITTEPKYNRHCN